MVGRLGGADVLLVKRVNDVDCPESHRGTSRAAVVPVVVGVGYVEVVGVLGGVLVAVAY